MISIKAHPPVAMLGCIAQAPVRAATPVEREAVRSQSGALDRKFVVAVATPMLRRGGSAPPTAPAGPSDSENDFEIMDIHVAVLPRYNGWVRHLIVAALVLGGSVASARAASAASCTDPDAIVGTGAIAAEHLVAAPREASQGWRPVKQLAIASEKERARLAARMVATLPASLGARLTLDWAGMNETLALKLPAPMNAQTTQRLGREFVEEHPCLFGLRGGTPLVRQELYGTVFLGQGDAWFGAIEVRPMSDRDVLIQGHLWPSVPVALGRPDAGRILAPFLGRAVKEPTRCLHCPSYREKTLTSDLFQLEPSSAWVCDRTRKPAVAMLRSVVHVRARLLGNPIEELPAAFDLATSRRIEDDWQLADRHHGDGKDVTEGRGESNYAHDCLR